jgi:hypothetical protein
MKNTFKLFLFFAILSAGCAPKKDKFQAFAEDLCTCMKPMAELQKEVMQLADEGREDEIMSILEKGQKIDQEGQACIAGLEAKHGTIETEEAEGKMMEAMRKACPEIVQLMEESAAPAPEEMLEEEDTLPAEEQ